MTPGNKIQNIERADSGFLVLTVTLVILFVMFVTVSVINSTLVVETRAIEDSLAKLRSYWAMVGHQDYALSRARYASVVDSGLCAGESCNNDTARVVRLNSFLGEIGGLSTGYYQETISYSEYPNTYEMTVRSLFGDIDTNADGNLVFRARISALTAPAVVHTSSNTVMGVRAELCVSRTGSGASCGIGNLDDTDASGFSTVDSFRRVRQSDVE